jgi:hypothetical protein
MKMDVSSQSPAKATVLPMEVIIVMSTKRAGGISEEMMIEVFLKCQHILHYKTYQGRALSSVRGSSPVVSESGRV